MLYLVDFLNHIQISVYKLIIYSQRVTKELIMSEHCVFRADLIKEIKKMFSRKCTYCEF